MSDLFETGLNISPTTTESIKYINETSPVFANNVYGNSNPDGTFTLYFISELINIPEEAKLSIKDNRVVDEKLIPEAQTIKRHVVSTIILSPQLIQELPDFLRTFNLNNESKKGG